VAQAGGGAKATAATTGRAAMEQGCGGRATTAVEEQGCGGRGAAGAREGVECVGPAPADEGAL
jgi:hypothetical protein